MAKTKKDMKKPAVKDNSARIAQYTNIVVEEFIFTFKDATVDECATFGADVCLRIATIVKDFYKGENDREKIENAIGHMQALIDSTINPPVDNTINPTENKPADSE